MTGSPLFEPPADTEQTTLGWYGWETLSLDAAAIGLGVMSYSTFDGKGTGGALLGSGASAARPTGAGCFSLAC